MFRIKICGVTSIADARAAADAGADAIGLNFFSKSRRFVDDDLARQIAAAIPNHVTKVGVFVNREAEDIAEIAERVGLDAVQLHGDEPPDIVAQLPSHVQIVRAHHCGQAGLTALATFLQRCSSLGRQPDAILVDAEAGSSYGGSGELADWARIDHERAVIGALPLILAGGLTPENVAAAISTVRPRGVDTASGVEREPGRKDHALVARFVAAAREALERLE